MGNNARDWIDGGGYSSSTSSFSFGGLVNTSGSSASAPKAFLNWIIFDRDYNFKDGGFIQVSEAAKETGTDGPHEKLSKNDILIKEPGYIYIYLSNEEASPVEVFFDDFNVAQVKSPVIQMDDYYPFGLTFNSYRRENNFENKIRFQGQEHVDDLGLNWDAFKWRNHQPDIGRFFNIDPLAEKYFYNSPYAFSENKVVAHIELEGLEAVGIAADDYVQAMTPKPEPGTVEKIYSAIGDFFDIVGGGGFIVESSTQVPSNSSDKGNRKGDPDSKALDGSPLLVPMVQNGALGLVMNAETEFHVIEKNIKIDDVVKEEGGDHVSLDVKAVKDTTESKNFTQYTVTTTSGKDSTIQVSKTLEKKDDQKK